MKNVTITLEEKVASWVRVHAAKQETSVSRFVGDILKEKMIAEDTYQVSMQYYLSQAPRKLKKPGTSYPGREEIHER